MASDQSTYIDEELWPDILKRVVDLKTLCRFRCVCKLWNSLLFSYDSIHKLTFNPAIAADKSYLLINDWNPNTVYRPQATSNRALMHFPDFPFLPCLGTFTIIDAIHGLVCLSYAKHSMHRIHYKGVFLWMPLVNKYVDIPRSDFEKRYGDHEVVGFGHRSSKNDFKVVGFSFYDTLPVCEVFSVQDRLWRFVEPCGEIVRPKTQNTGFFVNGNIHWISRRVNPREVEAYFCLLVFDCEREELKTMEVPLGLTGGFEVLLLNHHGKLSLFKNTTSLMEEYLELWVMEEYGAASTWNKLFYISHGYFRRQPFMFIGDEILNLKPHHIDGLKGKYNSKVCFPLHCLALEESILSTDPRIQLLLTRRKRKMGRSFI